MDKKILADYRLSDIPEYFNGYESELMTIPDEIRDCVAFIGCNLKGTRDFVLGGTAFFVSMKSECGNARALYAITARHVIESVKKESADQKIFLQVNDCKSGTRKISTSYNDWFFHPFDDSADVAVFPMSGLDGDFDQKFFPYDRFATGDILRRAKIRLGEEIFMTGLFHPHPGAKKNLPADNAISATTTRNIPIVRVGNIATMPEQKIRSKNFNGEDVEVEGYLVEARSLAGISGSPVFAVWDQVFPQSQQISWSGGNLENWKGEDTESKETVDTVGSVRRQFCLMGILHGHYDLPTMPFLNFEGTKNQLNLGVAIVVPISKIVDVLWRSEVKGEREKLFKERRASNSMVTLDSRFSD